MINKKPSKFSFTGVLIYRNIFLIELPPALAGGYILFE